MYHKHHTKGIIISNKIEASDSCRVSIFTEDFGVISARAQGARTLHNKFRGGVQEFCVGEFSLVRGKTGWRVVGTRAEKNLFEDFKHSPEKLKIVFNVLNLIKKLVAEDLPTQAEEKHSLLFDTIAKFFVFLQQVKENEIALAECLTLMRVIHILGYMRYDPELAVPLSSSEIAMKDLETIAPCRFKIVTLINESLRAV